MDGLSGVALAIVGVYVLYCVIRHAVRDGIRDARKIEQKDRREASTQRPD